MTDKSAGVPPRKLVDYETLLAKVKAASKGEPETWGFVAMFIEMMDASVAPRLASHAEREGAEWNYQCPTEARECEAVDFCKKHKECGRSGTPIPALQPAPSPAGPDALAEVKFVESLAYKEEFIHMRSHDIVFAIADALRSRPAQEDRRDAAPKVYQACARHQHLPIWIQSAPTFMPTPVCPHCEQDAAMSQQEKRDG